MKMHAWKNIRPPRRLPLWAGASLLAILSACGSVAAADSKPAANSLGLELVQVPAGSFLMGQDAEGDWDERPAHQVTISKPYLISATEITLEQYRRFRPAHQVSLAGKATGVSWHDAAAFCEWLSRNEGKPFRLPTEAEWEYACRAGTTTRFWSGDQPPANAEAPNPWGLKGLYDSVAEWCHDWHGPYRAQAETDPVGPSHGMARVVRGDKLDTDEKLDNPERTRPPYYHRSANRAGMAPAFGVLPAQLGKLPAKPAKTKDEGWSSCGQHAIGFRVVQAPLPTTAPYAEAVPFVRQGVKAAGAFARLAPEPAKPYFRKRFLLPVPPDNSPDEEIAAAGLHPSFRHHNHSPALEVCPNGDVLLVIYTSYREYEPGVSLMAARLRFGADQWDMPDPMFDQPDANDHAPMLWTDWADAKLYFFWGSPQLAHGAFPFQWMTSADSGATWSEVQFPLFSGPIGPHARQPINTAVRGLDGTLFVASDAAGATSVLWASKDNGRTWYDTEGRSAGRHTTYCLLKDGRLLGMGGKNSDLDGFMPKAISSDGGKTWAKSKTPFSPLANNQRPSLLRLQSGRLFMAGDFQPKKGKKPAAIAESGSYVALSDDQGEHWHIKRIAVAQPHESDHREATLGYSAARQAPNGMIHLISSMTEPCLHFEMNEAWILSQADAQATDADLMPCKEKNVTAVTKYEQTYPSGKPRITWSAGRAETGRYVLDGEETWFFDNGKPQYQAGFKLGRKVGKETLWRPDGSVAWEWLHQPDGSSQWTQYWENGQKKAQSTWKGALADGPAQCWDRGGKLLSEVTFVAGKSK